jgi:hypothetical protein
MTRFIVYERGYHDFAVLMLAPLHGIYIPFAQADNLKNAKKIADVLNSVDNE